MFDLAKFRRRNNQTGWARVFVLMIVIWSALLAGSLAWDMHLQQQSILEHATIAARANIHKDQSFRKWAATHGGVYVPPTEHTPPNPYLQVPDRDVVTTTGKTLTLMNPAYMLRQLQSDFPGDYGTRSHITSLKPLNPNNAPDVWEAKALHAFEQGGKEFLEAQQIDGQPYLRMMLPLIVEPGCLKCHAQQGYKLGDIRGGISSAVPLAPFLAREREFRDSLVLSHGAIWLIGLAGLAWLGVSFRRVQRLKILVSTAAAVEESERRFRAVTQSANDAIISADSAGNIVGWNTGAERLFGYTEAEIIGQLLTVLMPERFRNLHREGLARVAAGETPQTVELVGLRKDGSEFPLELSLAQWEATGGQFFTAIIRDITERKRAEVGLRNSEEKFSKAFRASPDVLIISRRADGLIIEANDGWERLFGYSREESIGSRSLELGLFANPADRQRAVAQLQEQGFVRDFEVAIKRKTGAMRQVILSVEPIEIDNEPCMLTIIHDITERKQAEAKLAEQLDELQRWHNATSGREGRVLGLKHEVNELLVQAGQPPRYPSAELSNAE